MGEASAVKPAETGPEGGTGCAWGEEPGRGGAPGAPPGWFIMSIVPLNFGAAPVLSAKLHLAQVCAVSVFWVPQFGQNTTTSAGFTRRRDARAA